MTLSSCQISSLHVWVARKHGPLHFTLAYIVYRESRTRQVVDIHVHYGVHGEKYIGIYSCLIDLSLWCIICSQINTIRVLVSKPEVQIMNILSPERVVVRRVLPRGRPQQHPVAWESLKWANNLAGWADWRLNAESGCPRLRKIAGLGVLCKIRAVWPVYL